MKKIFSLLFAISILSSNILAFAQNEDNEKQPTGRPKNAFEKIEKNLRSEIIGPCRDHNDCPSYAVCCNSACVRAQTAPGTCYTFNVGPNNAPLCSCLAKPGTVNGVVACARDNCSSTVNNRCSKEGGNCTFFYVVNSTSTEQ